MTKPNAIEEILAHALALEDITVTRDAATGYAAIQDRHRDLARECLAALDAAGLAVVPKEAEEYQLLDCPADIAFGDLIMVYRLGVAGFDPTTWKPKP